MAVVGVLASGSGSILAAILDAGIPVRVVVVDRPCKATEIAAAAGVPAELVERTSFGADFDRLAYTEQVVDVLQRTRSTPWRWPGGARSSRSRCSTPSRAGSSTPIRPCCPP
ncbi:MAG TPA: hypothetical protein VHF47_08515, partial [Acidimicrobiales bacterium]|nr:hypothetical protein [Acidimicrobiales bacterium]